jgi:RHS repeat-associated protein
MNKMSIERRAAVLSSLVEGNSIASTCRMFGVNKVTVLRLLSDAGQMALDFHDLTVRNLATKRVQVDEIWSFCYCKNSHVNKNNYAPGRGDSWTWVSMDADSKLAINWLVGGRSGIYANEFVGDLADRLTNRVQITSDGWDAYRTAINKAFGAQTNTVNSQNEETAAGANTLAFDNNGNTTTDDQGHTLVYDAWTRLVTVTNGGTTLVSYVYDDDGNRISRTASGTTTDLYNSAAGQVLEERQSGTVTNQYVWSLAYINALVLRDDDSTGGSYGKSSSGLGRRLYVQQDADYNVTALTNTSAAVQQRFVYTPYGIMTVIDGTTNWSTTTDAYSWVYTFQGGRLDATSGMIHFGAREYSPTLGRWLQQDPAEYIDGANAYQFEISSPIGQLDPTGLSSKSPSNAVSQIARLQKQIQQLTDLRSKSHCACVDGQMGVIQAALMADLLALKQSLREQGFDYGSFRLFGG